MKLFNTETKVPARRDGRAGTFVYCQVTLTIKQGLLVAVVPKPVINGVGNHTGDNAHDCESENIHYFSPPS